MDAGIKGDNMNTGAIRNAIRHLPTSVPLSVKGAALDELAKIDLAISVLIDIENIANDVVELADYDNLPDGWISKADSTLTAISNRVRETLWGNNVSK